MHAISLICAITSSESRCDADRRIADLVASLQYQNLPYRSVDARAILLQNCTGVGIMISNHSYLILSAMHAEPSQTVQHTVQENISSSKNVQSILTCVCTKASAVAAVPLGTDGDTGLLIYRHQQQLFEHAHIVNSKLDTSINPWLLSSQRFLRRRSGPYCSAWNASQQ